MDKFLKSDDYLKATAAEVLKMTTGFDRMKKTIFMKADAYDITFGHHYVPEYGVKMIDPNEPVNGISVRIIDADYAVVDIY